MCFTIWIYFATNDGLSTQEIRAWKFDPYQTLCFQTVKRDGFNQDRLMQWFDSFQHNIPPTRPALLIQDGYGSHVSIEFIESFICWVYLPTQPTSCSHSMLEFSNPSRAISPRHAANTLLPVQDRSLLMISWHLW